MARRRTWLRILIGGLAGLVIVILAAMILLPLLVPVGLVRDRIILVVKQSTGRDLAIKGALSISYFPIVGVTAKDVSLSNAPWAGAQPMLSLASLKIGVRILPLLSGRLELADFVLESPTILLAIDRQGRGNWQFAPTPVAAQAAHANARASSAPPNAASPAAQPAESRNGIPEIALGDVHIDHGHLTYIDGVAGKTEQVEDVNLKMALPNLDAPLTATGSAQWRGKMVNLTLHVAAPRPVIDGAGGPVDVALDSDMVKLAFDGKAALAPATHLDGAIDLSAPSLRALLGWAVVPAPALPGKDTFGALSFKGKVTMNGSRIALSELALSLDSIKTTGALTLDTGGVRPKLSGSLAFDALDVNPYLAPAAPAAHGGATSPAANPAPAPAVPRPRGETESGWSTEPIDLSGLKSADLDLSIAAKSIAFRKFDIGRSALKLTLTGGRFTADLSQLSLYSGTVTGKVTVDGTAPAAAVTANLGLDKVEAEPLLKAAADTDQVHGALALSTTVTASGGSERALVSSLNGNGRFGLSHGVIEGVDLVGLIQGALSSVTGGVVGGSGGKTDISNAGGTFTITKGILKNTDLKLDAPLLTATGAGTVDIPDKRVDYRLEPKLVSSLSVPVIVSGSWSDIGWRPDLQGLVVNNIDNAGQLLGRSGKALSSPVDKVLNGLGGLFGK